MAWIAGDVETVTVVRLPAKDPRTGDPLAGSEEQTEVAGCLFAPGSSSTTEQFSHQVDTDAVLYAPAGTDVRVEDRVMVRGDVYEVVGKPRVWSSAGLEVDLRQVTG